MKKTKSSAPRAKLKQLKPPPQATAARESNIQAKLKKGDSDRKRALAQAKEWSKDPELVISTNQWHQISTSLGGIFIVRTIEMPNEIREEEIEKSTVPFDVLSFDELCASWGDDEAAEMSEACRELSIENQIDIAIEEIAKCGVRSASKQVAAILASEGIKLKQAKAPSKNQSKRK